MKTPDTVLSDFKQWASNVLAEGLMTLSLDARIKEALERAYEQGYQSGLNQGWSHEQDKDYANKEGDKA